MFADRYFLFPVVALAFAGLMVLLCRWAFSRPKGGSLVRRTDYSPADPATFGLLVAVRTTPDQQRARLDVTTLKNFGIKATLARTTTGWTVYVWPVDEPAARGLLDAA